MKGLYGLLYMGLIPELRQLCTTINRNASISRSEVPNDMVLVQNNVNFTSVRYSITKGYLQGHYPTTQSSIAKPPIK